jgi:ketosteroid isomerase-like protein
MDRNNLYEAELLNVDKKFDLETAEHSADGWVSYFAENGVMLNNAGPIIGKEAIYETMKKAFSDNGVSLRWEPIYAKASKDGTMGYTYGKYVRTSKDSEGNPTEATGHYTSIWEKQDNGEYKIVLDMGN